ncbi:LAME_0E07206g1_1 [Lachancea meyersii CBS 8951]|uniref:Ornithine decarboxylase n=1 Tax=Lachancea meyersii CBS 8951 TaxID=1266667 RepID=A0A1G4JIF2_9SACH|nr:LAME_0E07206g1_1 [Lachancea meyersii CBS 8951]
MASVENVRVLTSVTGANGKEVRDFDAATVTSLVSTGEVGTPSGKLSSLGDEKAHAQTFHALQERVNSVNQEVCEAGDENSFFVCDLGEVQRLHAYWRAKLPRVHPFYAVKSNPNPKVLQLLAQMGVNFDCASKSEIEMVLELGVCPSRIIYANPCKASSFIRFAKDKQVRKSTFDNVEELAKIKKYHPDSELLLRIATDDSTAKCRLSTKYGCAMENVDQLLAKVKELGLNMVGVSFHIGSGASDFSTFYKAVRDAREVFDRASGRFGLQNVRILDIGGGFQLETFGESSYALNVALEEFFPPRDGEEAVTIIAEPGRFFAASPFTLACHVIAKRAHNDRESMLYINDGVYGNMNCILFDHQEPLPRVLYHDQRFHYLDDKATSPKKSPSCQIKASIWGPTCDGLDCITKEYYFKHDLVVGDWLYFPVLGAYTSSAATQFNGFEQAVDIIYINSASEL